MLSLPDIYNWVKTQFLKKSGGTMDTGAVIGFPSVSADKIRLYGTAYGLGINSNEFTIYLSSAAELKLRDNSVSGSVRGTVWHTGNDGSGSGLDADLLDGLNSATAATPSTIPQRDSLGDIRARLMRSDFATQATALGATDDICFRRDNASDDYMRFIDRANLITWLEAGGLGGMTVAHYTGNCDGVGTTTDVTITSVTTTQAYIQPTMEMTQAATGTGISSVRFTSSTNVQITHSNNYASSYFFSVVSSP